MSDDLFSGKAEDRQGEHAHARRTDPQTSHDAAAAITPSLPSLQAHVERFALRFPDGFTDVDLLADRPDKHPSTLRTRRAELVARNIILDSGQQVVPDGHTQKHTIWLHRSFVDNPPELKDPPAADAASDKAMVDEAEALRVKLKSAADAMHREGRVGAEQLFNDADQMIGRLLNR